MNFTEQFENYQLENFGYVRLPSIVLTEQELSTVGSAKDNADFLKKIVYNGFKNRGFTRKNGDYLARLTQEFNTVVELGFTDYFLLVWRVCNFCEKNGIMRDYGRGSCAGSLMFYCIGVTEIDPIKYGLFFERFISKTRAKKKEINNVTFIDGSLAPDVDLDVDPTKRHLVIEYLNSLYPNRLCKILNMSELSGKVLIKECGKIIKDKQESEMMEVSSLISKHFGIVADLEDAYKDEPAFRKWCDQNKQVYDIALKMRNLYKNSSTHASGYVVSYDPLLDIMPLQLTKDKEPVSCYTMADVSYLTIKLDILGSRCSAVVDDCCKQLGIDWREINVDSDPYIYDNLKFGLKHPHGIFQLEADCNLRVVNEVKPKDLLELSDVVAMARPGALAYVDKYVENKCESINAIFDPILEKTRGVCLYQEQMMKLAHALGFTLEEAEILRRIVGKKKVEEVKAWKEKIYAKCTENKHPASLGDLLWKILDDSSKYSFNLSHSVSFAALSALTIYLKYKYPLQFFTALLNQAKNEQNPLQEINIIRNELADFGIKLLPPNLTKSEMEFKIEDNNIRYGLALLRGISDKTIVKLKTFRKQYNNRFEYFEAAKECKISFGILTCLIQSGCLSDDAEGRSALVYEAHLYNLLTEPERKLVSKIFTTKGEELKDLRDILKYMLSNKNDKGKLYISEKRKATLIEKSKPYKDILAKNSQNEKLAIYYYEKNSAGYPYTYTLRDIDTDFKSSLSTIRDIKSTTDDNEQVFLICEVIESAVRVSKNKKKYLKMTVEDDTGQIDALAFESSYGNMIDEIMEENGGKLPVAGDIVYIKGKKRNDAVFLSKCDIQTFKIYTKLADLQKDLEKENEEKVIEMIEEIK